MFLRQDDYYSYDIDLTGGLEDVWDNFRRDTKRGIVISKKKGLRVYSTRDEEQIDRYYDLNCITKRRIGVPSHPKIFFKNLFKIMGENTLLYLAEYDGTTVAGMIVKYYRDTAYAAYSGSNPQYNNVHPNDAINWKIIEDLHQQGYRHYDLGRANHCSKGLIAYKKSWGAREKKIIYSYYPHCNRMLTNNRENYRYRLGSLLMQSLPMPAYEAMNKVVYKYLG
jgi:lipid II:glycine glycyltransferase (peptidoglycan interpeptide bridge formation enzyme)